MRIYICSFWAGETRFHTRYILVWDQLVLARELHGEFCGESLGSAGLGGASSGLRADGGHRVVQCARLKV